MPEINFNQIFKTLDGEKSLQDQENKDFSLRTAAVDALLGVGLDDKMPGTKKADRFALAQKVHQSNGSVELSNTEIEEIKKVVGEAYAPIVVGQAFEMLKG